MPSISGISANSKHWVPYDGPADFSFVVRNAPKKELEEGGGRQEFSHER
jgi:hypothetical protein